MARHDTVVPYVGRRGFLKGAAVVGAAGFAPWVLSACTPSNGNGGTPGRGLPEEFFQVPEDALRELMESEIPADQQRMTVEQWIERAENAYDPPIEISTATPNSPVAKYPSGESLEDNMWTRAYESRYGIKVTTQFSVDQSQWEQRTNLMIGSGDLPDFFLASQSQLDQLVRADLIQDMTSIYRDHAPARLRASILEGGRIPLQSAVYNGRLMAVPFTEQMEVAPNWFIRKDWLDNLGLAVPETMQELLTAIEAFTTEDPEGNGAADTYGLAVGPQASQNPADLAYLQAFFNGYHAYRGIWIERDGKLEYGSIQPEMKEALEQLQRMYTAKQLHPEFGVRTEQNIFEDWGAHRVGLMMGRGSAPSGTNLLKESNPAAEVIALPVLSIDGEVGRVQQSQPNVRGYWVVRKGYEHPEAILAMLDFFVQTFYLTPSAAIETAFKSDGAEPNLWTLNKAAAYRAYKNTDSALAVTELLDAREAPTAARPDLVFWYNQILPVVEGGTFNGQAYRSYVGFYGPDSGRAVQDLYRREQRYQFNQFYGVPTRTMSQRQATLDSLEAETLTRIIQGASVSEFDTFVSEWKRIAGDTITQEVNDWRAQQ